MIELKFYKSQSAYIDDPEEFPDYDGKPTELDTTSSKYYTYIRQNIKQIEVTDSTSQEEEPTATKMWEYEEAKLTKEEYAQYISEQALSEADTQTMLGLVEQAETSEDQNETVTLALADLATQIEQNKTEVELALAELAAAPAE